MRYKWTNQQKRAIFARGNDLLVTASAGTGKTAVLSGRCVHIVSDKSDVRNMLVLTFTDAAAEQMRSRIAEQLKDAFLEKRDSHLRYQLMLLQGADISTIHSFCKRLITEHFYKLDLDPTFSVIDSDEQKLLKAEVLEKTIDWAWQQSNLVQGLKQLLQHRGLRTNDGFLAKVIELSDFLDGVVSRDNWYERAAQLAEITNPFTTGLGEKQKQIVANELRNILAQIQYAMRLYERENAGGNWAIKWKQTLAEPVVKYIELIEAGHWEKFSEEIRSDQRPSRYEYKPRGLSGLAAEIIKNVAESAKKSYDKLFELAILNPDYLDRLAGSVGLQTRVLIELVKKFDRLYSQTKRTLNCLDFADLEHYALKLLTDENSPDDKPAPSETALVLRQRYKHIFVDEYQDINSVQQRILDVLSPGGNILEVGDVKQSIYAFRGAEPDIFLKQLKLASADPRHAPNGLRVDLNANFRSAKGILDFVNRIFERIMTASFTKIDYDESARLRPALVSSLGAQGTGHVVELHILDETDYDLQDEKYEISSDEENLNLVTYRQRQAAMIARRIRQMVGADTGRSEFQICDKEQDCLRDVQYRDIVVLMRSLAKKANDYLEVFRLAGVPVSCQATAGYFEATEISDVLCLLKVLDNPQRDIELAAVLRSQFFKISDTELAKIKIHSRTGPPKRKKTRLGNPDLQHSNYYNCVLRYCESGPDAELVGRLKQILTQIERWRTLARRGNLADLLWQLYRQTGFLSFVCALPNGQARRVNLLKLHDRAIQFEGFASSAGVPSLTRFVEFIEKLQEVGQDWAPAEPDRAAGNAVRILSVHKSKGLEFPVVFLAELDSRFNKSDIQADLIADADDTLGLQIIDRTSNSKLSSLAHEVIAEKKLSTALAEEMRILYVAMTRARDRLILTASQKQTNCRRIISNGFFFGSDPVPDWQLRGCQSPLEWILYGLSEQKVLHNAFETGLPSPIYNGQGLAAQLSDDNLFSMKLYSRTELEQLSRFVLGLKADKSSRAVATARKSRSKPTEAKLLSQVKKSLAWQYRFGEASLLPAKNSVTQLTHRNDEYVRFDYSRALARQPRDEGRGTSDKGRMAIGSATHLVISQLDLAVPVTEESVERIKGKLLADNAITTTVAEHIDTESIMAFFESELGRLALDAENIVWREWPFTFALPASELIDSSHGSPTTDGETVIVQGIIDMLVRTPDGLVVIDFKTDNITAKQVPERAKVYSQQLDLYAEAAGAILKDKLLNKWLYFLSPRCSIEV